VYQATDTNLKRRVALKVLPTAVTAEAGHLARFQREAEILASLNHPAIATIHGLERADGVTALVMELVEGPTFADRLALAASRSQASDSGLPVEEALAIARQMAEALEAAHEQGIVHRDLKPANVKVQPNGTDRHAGGCDRTRTRVGAPSRRRAGTDTHAADVAWKRIRHSVFRTSGRRGSISPSSQWPRLHARPVAAAGPGSFLRSSWWPR
jgi:serine/threonine protein kinase